MFLISVWLFVRMFTLDIFQVKQNIEDKSHQHIDARSKARYSLLKYACLF